MKIRASIGSAAVLGLENIILEVPPTTAYLMLYTNSHCLSNCSFCPQARESSSKSNKLSRVIWPVYETNEIIDALNENSIIKRICIQTISFPGSDEQLLALLEELMNSNLKIPITVCSYPANKELLKQMKNLGVTRIGISFDCATPSIFNKVKGVDRGPTLSWAVLEEALIDAMEIFGNRFASTHLIIGLGETEKEAIQFIQDFNNRKVTVGLFALTPIKGTDLEFHSKPNLSSYRRIQLARYLIVNDIISLNDVKFEDKQNYLDRIVDYGLEKAKLLEIIKSGKPFQTSGCSHCNRPFYNESPGKDMYNFPRKLTKHEIEDIKITFSEFL